MIQVKAFDEQHEADLEQEINAFLKNHPELKIRQIQYATSCMCVKEEQIYCFTALIVYEI